MNHYQVLSHASEEQVCQLAFVVLQGYPEDQIHLISGPQRGLVLLQVRETVVNSKFHAGEVLVTEVKLELDGQLGFGMVIGDSPRKATAVALVDAAVRKGGEIAARLEGELTDLERQIHSAWQEAYKVAASSKVQFDLI